MKAGVIGYPIKHSKSPVIHGHWMDTYNIDGDYQKIEIEPDNLNRNIKKLIQEKYNGFNVTIPFKEDIFKLCDYVDEHAKKIGAVNTVHIKDGQLYGTNTDAFGFIQNIKENSTFQFENKCAFILGAGGASRAIIYGLLNEGIEKIYLSNRTRKRAEELQAMSPDKIEIVEWGDKENSLYKTDLLINATSLGMVGQNVLSIDLTALPDHAIVTDIVYTPLMTPLLKQAQDKGHEIVTGIGMLLHQARPSFEAWTGIMPDVTSELEALALEK